MAWRYINPGYVHLLDAATQVKATQYIGYEKSKTGVGYLRQGTPSPRITIDSFNENDDFWGRFDVYIPSGSFEIYVYLPRTNNAGIDIFYYSGGICISRMKGFSSLSGSYDDMGIKVNQINSFLLHAKYGDSSTAYMDIRINDKQLERATGNAINFSTSYNPTASLFSVYNDSAVSNIIFSNEEINIKEQVVALPVSSTETAMSLQSDTYLADSAGQTLLQSVNVSSLISNFGSDSKVTGIALVGNPAYRTGEQLSSLTAISKTGGTVTEYGTSNLSTDSDTVIWQSVPVASDTTIADLQNIQLGWKAGE